MFDILFGDIGVNVKNYWSKGIHRLFVENGLDKFIKVNFYSDKEYVYREGTYLQAECRGLISEITKISALSGYIRYTTDMDTYLLILRTALLDIDLANDLINNLYYEGLIKPRTLLWDILTLAV